MSSFVFIKGKKYKLTSGNEVIETNTNEDLHNHFYNTSSSIDAKWTAHIKKINEQLATITKYSPGRPKKVVETGIEDVSEMQR